MPRTGPHPPVAVTVDLVVLTVREDQLQALTIRRGEEPYQGQWALPGGFLQPDEDLRGRCRARAPRGDRPVSRTASTSSSWGRTAHPTGTPGCGP